MDGWGGGGLLAVSAQEARPALPGSLGVCVWGGAAVFVSVGGVLFALVAWQLLGYWGNLSQLPMGAV